MYTEFLKGLAELAEKLDEVAKIGSDSDSSGLPTPYVAGSIEVRLDGEVIGYFDFEDEYVLYREKPPEALKTTVKSEDEDALVAAEEATWD